VLGHGFDLNLIDDNTVVGTKCGMQGGWKCTRYRRSSCELSLSYQGNFHLESTSIKRQLKGTDWHPFGLYGIQLFEVAWISCEECGLLTY
jgi:hypothetical protein